MAWEKGKVTLYVGGVLIALCGLSVFAIASFIKRAERTRIPANIAFVPYGGVVTQPASPIRTSVAQPTPSLAATPAPASTPVPTPKPPVPPSSNANAKSSVAEIVKRANLNTDNDVVVFVIDASGSMSDDTADLKKNIGEIVGQYSGKYFAVVFYTYEAEATCSPTRNVSSLEAGLDAAPYRLSNDSRAGSENSLLALNLTAKAIRQSFKKPAIFLITDAAPNDASFFQTPMPELVKQAADELNAANASLIILAGFDSDEASQEGTAIDSADYVALVKLIKAGGEIKPLR